MKKLIAIIPIIMKKYLSIAFAAMILVSCGGNVKKETQQVELSPIMEKALKPFTANGLN